MPRTPLEGLKIFFSPLRGSKNVFRIDFPQKQKILDRTLDNHCKCVQNAWTHLHKRMFLAICVKIQFYRPIKKIVNTRVVRMIPTEMRCISYTNVLCSVLPNWRYISLLIIQQQSCQLRVVDNP